MSEGVSYLLILSVALDVISRDFVFPIGMAHGVLFLIYLCLSLSTSHQRNWSLFTWLLVFVASIVPFAFIAVDFFLKKDIKQSETLSSQTASRSTPAWSDGGFVTLLLLIWCRTEDMCTIRILLINLLSVGLVWNHFWKNPSSVPTAEKPLRFLLIFPIKISSTLKIVRFVANPLRFWLLQKLVA